MRTRERDIFRKYLERRGLKLTAERQAVFDVLFVRHEHVEWSRMPQEERDRLSKRNFYRFLHKWGERRDLLVGEN